MISKLGNIHCIMHDRVQTLLLKSKINGPRATKIARFLLKWGKPIFKRKKELMLSLWQSYETITRKASSKIQVKL